MQQGVEMQIYTADQAPTMHIYINVSDNDTSAELHKNLHKNTNMF